MAKREVLAAEWPNLLLHPPRKWTAREGRFYQLERLVSNLLGLCLSWK